jgi:hypothetical protein
LLSLHFWLKAPVNDKKKIDIINEILEDCIVAFPVSSFIISLYQQYQQRGSLSKKQLQGLHAKASTISGLADGKLGTLEAIIKKMPTRFKSVAPPPKPLYEKEESTLQTIKQILQLYPQHKGVLFLKAKYDNNEPFTPSEMNDLKRFSQLITKKA